MWRGRRGGAGRGTEGSLGSLPARLGLMTGLYVMVPLGVTQGELRVVRGTLKVGIRPLNCPVWPGWGPQPNTGKVTL